MFDPRRQRSLPLRLRLPAGEGDCPLILFSHGLGGNLDAGELWARAWQAAGFAVLQLQHAGSDSALLRQGPRALRRAANGEQLQARCADVGFVLDTLAQRSGETPWRRLRLEAVGMAGHSFGAQTTLALAGRLFADGRSLSEARLHAFAAFSPAVGEAGAASLRAIRRPLLGLTGSLDGNPLGAEERGDYRREVFDALPAGAKAELWLDGADHSTFGGASERRPLQRRPAEAQAQAARHQALIAQVSSAWWRARLLGDTMRSPQGLGPRDEWRVG